MKFKPLTIVLAAGLMLASCSSSKNSLTYFQDIKTSVDGTFDSGDYSIEIMPDDELFISVTSLVPEATMMYNLPVTNPATISNIKTTMSPAQQTYLVDSEGDIIFPVLGRLHVEGLTTRQLATRLTDMISREVEDPVVNVELVNFTVNVIGEVKEPGRQDVKRQRYTLFDALAAAGDMTVYGERSNVLLVREENGKTIYHRFDLNDSKTVESPYFYLKQNDVVYVEPNAIRKDNAKYNQNNSFKISVISTVVSACSVIASLIIALVVK